MWNLKSTYCIKLHNIMNNQQPTMLLLKAPTTDVGYVPNAKYLAHIPHQTLKTHFIRCAKSKKFYMWIVPLQICNGTDEKWYNSYFFILFSLSSLFSLFFSLLSHLCFLSSVLYEEWHKFAPSLFSLTPSPISHRLHFASSSPISPGIVIVIADRNRCGHRCWGEIGVFVTIVGIDVEILIMGIDVEVRWDLDRGLPVLVAFGCWCKWVADASSFVGLGCLGFGCVFWI